MLVIAGWIRIDEAARERAQALALGMMEATRREEGCISYTFSWDLTDASLFHLFEEWQSQKALDAHLKAPHMADFQKQLGDLGVREVRVQRYEIASVGPLRP